MTLVPVLPCEADRIAAEELLGWLTDRLQLEGPGKLEVLHKIERHFARRAASARLAALEAAAKVAEEEPLTGTECLRPFRHEVGKSISTAIRSLSQPVEGSAGASVGPLVADLARVEWDFTCEACGAGLFHDDDFVSDPEGVTGCWAAMTDLPSRRERPCYAYRVGKPSAASNKGGRDGE